MRKTTVMLAMVVAMVAYSVASADVTVRVVDSFTGGHTYGAGAQDGSGWDFGQLPDFGIIGFDGPLNSAGSGPVPAGFLPDKIAMDSAIDGPGGGSRGAGGTGLVGVGPSAGFGNPSNFVGANFFTDAFSMYKVDGGFHLPGVHRYFAVGRSRFQRVSLMVLTLANSPMTQRSLFQAARLPMLLFMIGTVVPKGSTVRAFIRTYLNQLPQLWLVSWVWAC